MRGGIGPGLGSGLRVDEIRFPSKTLMETPGIRARVGSMATLLPKDQVAPARYGAGDVVMGHGVKTITRMPKPSAASRSSTCWCLRSYPTAWSVLSERKDGTYLLPASPVRDGRLSHRLEPVALQWGRENRGAGFRVEERLRTMYLLARKLGFADLMSRTSRSQTTRCRRKNILREINRGGCRRAIAGNLPNGSSFT